VHGMRKVSGSTGVSSSNNIVGNVLQHDRFVICDGAADISKESSTRQQKKAMCVCVCV
jgi:hypothetical protein